MFFNKIHFITLYICIFTLSGFIFYLYNDNQKYLKDLNSIFTPKDGIVSQNKIENSIAIEPYLIHEYCKTDKNNPLVNWQYMYGLDGTLIYNCKFKNLDTGYIADILCHELFDSKTFDGRSSVDQKSCELKPKINNYSTN